MASLSLSATHFDLRFREPFGIAHGIRQYTGTLFVRAAFNDLEGFGEAAIPPYLRYDAADLALRFHDWFPADMHDSQSIREVMARVSAPGTALPSPLRAAVDIAMHDLLGKLTGKPVRDLLSVPVKEGLCFYTIGFCSADEVAERVHRARDFKLFKVKLGDSNDHDRVEALLSAGVKVFCADANQAWKDSSKALEEIHWLKDRGCLFVEQPLPVDAGKDFEELYRKSPLSIVLDESVQDVRDLEAVRSVCHGVNVKLVKCGGQGPALELIRQANRFGLKVLMGCMSEGSCGAMAAAQFAGWTDWLDLDGPALITNDPFEGVVYKDGMLLPSGLPGTGAVLRSGTEWPPVEVPGSTLL
jgi:L-alanine-DL-glutamate epimerase-like enolase superfamily enzyme